VSRATGDKQKTIVNISSLTLEGSIAGTWLATNIISKEIMRQKYLRKFQIEIFKRAQ